MYWSSFWNTKKRLFITLLLVGLTVAANIRYFASGFKEVPWEVTVAWIPMIVLAGLAMQWVQQDKAKRKLSS